jgi:hypothetical protein
MDYEVYAYLQLGQDAQAKAVIDDMVTVSGFTETFLAGPFALAASPARYAVERGDWKKAAAWRSGPARCPTSRLCPGLPRRSARRDPATRSRLRLQSPT